MDVDLQIRSYMRRIARDGSLIVRYLHSSKQTEYLLVDAEGTVMATFTSTFGGALWKACVLWGLNSTKRYTRKNREGLIVAVQYSRLLVSYLDAESSEATQDVLREAFPDE